MRQALAGIEGTYGLLVIDADQPDRIVVARRGSPIVIGIGDREMLVASDVAALVRSHAAGRRPRRRRDGRAERRRLPHLRARRARPRSSARSTVDWDPSELRRRRPPALHAQGDRRAARRPSRAPCSAASTSGFATAHLGGIDLDARTALAIRRVELLGCGTAYYAGLAGAQLIEDIARIPADAEPAAEFRYRNPVIERDTLYVAISQSGETADTLAAVQEVKRRGGRVLALVNVVGSTIARECDGIYLHAGPEVSVASTKAFTSMLAALALLALHLGRVRDLGPGRRPGTSSRACARCPTRSSRSRRRGPDHGHRRAALRRPHVAVLHRARTAATRSRSRARRS